MDQVWNRNYNLVAMSVHTLIGFVTCVGLLVGTTTTSTDNYRSFVSGFSIFIVSGTPMTTLYIGDQAS